MTWSAKESMSTSLSRMAADLPPSSNVDGMRRSAQATAIARPAVVDPVKATLSIPGLATSRRPVFTAPGTMFTTPAGTSASITNSIST